MKPLLYGRIVVALYGVVLGVAAHAELRLATPWGDHAVVQRDVELPVWGWADAGATVTVTFKDQTRETQADADGRWQVSFDALPADARGAVLQVTSGGEALEAKDILVGEVWLCSGQSNMQWSVGSSDNAKATIARADHPLIRHIQAPRHRSNTPVERFDAKWEVASPSTVGDWTAVGYNFGLLLQETLDVPVGLINASWGGTRIEPWIPLTGFEQVEAMRPIYEKVLLQDPTSDMHAKAVERYFKQVEAWLAQSRDAVEAGQQVQPNPTFPDELKPLTEHQDPTVLYNGMLHAFVPFPLRGSIWYQGESNHSDGMAYLDKTRALLAGWRTAWDRPDLPYYFVQIAPFRYGDESPHVLAEFWEAQARIVEEIDHTGMVVINDIGNTKNIHPTNKHDVGRRLANLALSETYGLDRGEVHSPLATDLKIDGDRIVVTFDHVGDGLGAHGGRPLTDFEICGETVAWTRAEAQIIGPDKVAVSAAKVAKPLAVRFAWHKMATPSLENSAGLPAGAFRLGEPGDYDPMTTHAPESQDYELVYEIDLNNLGPAPSYKVDRHDEVGAFDRVAYYLTLEKDGETQWAWVSMDAFTDDASKLGIPTLASGADFQTKVDNLVVLSSEFRGADGAAGNIEFWPHNYSAKTGLNLPNASASLNDFDDTKDAAKADGYGSMQVHLTGRKQTVFAINNWKALKEGDLGIGNSPGKHPDWTFTRNAGEYTTKTLKVLVRKAQ